MQLLGHFRNKFLALLALLPYLHVELLQKEDRIVQMYILADGYDAIEEILFYNVTFNPEEIRNADTIVDLGAYVGTFTLYAALNSKCGSRIISVEPNPRAYKILVNNMLLFKNLRSDIELLPLNAAIWSYKSLVPLKLTSWSENVHVSRPSNFNNR